VSGMADLGIPWRNGTFLPNTFRKPTLAEEYPKCK
jgi:hypothetical protein